MKKRNVVIIAVICVCLLIITSVFMLLSNESENYKNITVTLYSQYNGAYIFELYSSGLLIVTSGNSIYYEDEKPKISDEEGEIGLSQNREREIIKGEVWLSQDQQNKIKKSIKGINKHLKFSSNVSDYWECNLNIDGREYEFTYGASIDKELDELLSLIIAYSPVEVLDRAGKVVQPYE